MGLIGSESTFLLTQMQGMFCCHLLSEKRQMPPGLWIDAHNWQEAIPRTKGKCWPMILIQTKVRVTCKKLLSCRYKSPGDMVQQLNYIIVSDGREILKILQAPRAFPESGDGKVYLGQDSLLLAGMNILCKEKTNWIWMEYDGLFFHNCFHICSISLVWSVGGWTMVFSPPNSLCFFLLAQSATGSSREMESSPDNEERTDKNGFPASRE